MSVHLIFRDKFDFQCTLEVFADEKGIIHICAEDNYLIGVNLDIPTAIKFAKTLRTEINKAKEAINE